MIRARQHLTFGLAKGQWKFLTRRYVFSHHLFPILIQKIKEFPKNLEKNRFLLSKIENKLNKSNSIFRLCQAPSDTKRGLTTILALELKKDLELKSSDIVATALVEGIPLVSQCISPPYNEPYIKTSFNHAHCPKAEELVDRLFFIKVDERTTTAIDQLEKLIEKISLRPKFFRRPYDITLNSINSDYLPSEFIHWRTNAVVCRSVSGALFVYDELFGKFYNVNEEIAKLVQEGSPKNGC